MKNIKKLPKIYQNEIDKPINNNKKYYYSFKNNDDRNSIMTTSDVELVLDGIFSGIHHAFNIPVLIQTSTKNYDTFLIARGHDFVLTIDHDKIRISDILSLKRKNP